MRALKMKVYRRRWKLKMAERGNCRTCAQPAVTRSYCRAHADYVNARSRKWAADRKVAPEKNAARCRVYYALKRGTLIRPSTCSRCGVADPKINAHHADYSKPLEVEWLCYRCHAVVDGRTA